MYTRAFVNDPVRLGFATFTATVLIQLAHEVEHIMQLAEKYVWHWTQFPGLLGQWFDFEWVHVLYNGALWIALLATWIIYQKNPGIWRASALAAAALTFVVFFQGYHWFEHLVRLVQYYRGNAKPPGILGQIFPVLELHFWLNSVVSTAMLLAYIPFCPWEALSLKLNLPWTRLPQIPRRIE